MFLDGNSFKADIRLFLIPGATHLCGKISVTFSGPVHSVVEYCTGNFLATGDYSCGRQVFRHSDKVDVYMKVLPDKLSWFIMEGKEVKMRSFSAPSMSPADKSVGPWEFRDEDRKWKSAIIIVT